MTASPAIIGAIAALIAVAIYATTRSGRSNAAAVPASAQGSHSLLAAANWFYGPVDYPTGNPSVGMPAHPEPTPTGFRITVPQKGQGELHYLTIDRGPIPESATQIVVEGTWSFDHGAKLEPVSDPAAPPLFAPGFIQRAGDRYTAPFDAYRWWHHPSVVQSPLAGPFRIVIPLASGWTGVQTDTEAKDPAGFRAALRSPGRQGMTFGGGTGLGHGMVAVGGNVSLEITNIAVQ